MGKKRKLGQLDEAPPQPAEAEKQKPEQVVVSVDDAGKPLEPGKQIGLIQAEVLPNPNEVAVQAFNPVPEIEAGPEEPPAKKRKERKKKQKQVDDCVDVAGKASEPSTEVGLIQAKPAEVPPPNPTVGVESGAGPSSNPVAEIGARAASLLLPNPVAKGEEKSEEARMIPEAKTEEGTVKKKKKKLREQMEMEKMQSTVTTQCGDDVERNGEAKSIEEDGPVKKRKKNKQKLGEVMEMQGGTVTACVDDVEKNGEAKINEMVQKPVQVVAEMEGSKDTVTVCIGVENNGTREKEMRQREKEKSRIAFSGDDAGKNVEAKTSEELEIQLKKRKQFKKREEERRQREKKTRRGVRGGKGRRRGGKGIRTFSVDDAGKIVEAKTSQEHKEDNTNITCVDAGKNVELLPSLVPNVERKPEVLTESEELEIWLKRCKQAAKREKEMRQREKEKSIIAFSGDDAGKIVEAKTSEELEIQLKKRKTRRGVRGGKGRRRGGKGRRTFSVDDAGKIVEAKTSQEHKEDNTVRNAMLTYRHRLVLTSTEWKKKELILGLRRKAVAEKQKEKKSTEEKVEKKKKASTNEKAEEETVKFLQVCVICRGKGHIISTCPLLNQAQTNNQKSGKKLPKYSQPLHHAELKNGTLVKDKASNCKEGESIVMNDEAGKLLGWPPMDTLMKEETSGVKEDESTVKNGEESSCTPEDIVMKDENTDDREDETIVKVDCASRPEECYVKRMTEQGPEAVNAVA